ncbi:hypothetical protein [Streptomyces sp. S186]|uniref:hypothetical protein n=1 Tax=Streptomyces sp. S186 TaxID=3434395 RepID=UPI003F679577
MSRVQPGSLLLDEFQVDGGQDLLHCAFAARSFGDRDHIAHAPRVATDQLNARARPWI